VELCSPQGYGCLSPTEFRWQSQNRATRDSTIGQSLKNHRAKGTPVHLIVRPTAKDAGKTQASIYSGELEFERWERDKPITVWWLLRTEIPTECREELRLPGS